MLTYATDEYNEFTFHYGPIQIIRSFLLVSTVLHLHSTMVLFKCEIIVQIRSYLLIYIPLWSYSNFQTNIQFASIVIIYIPLWSYSNVKSISTKSTLYLNLHSTMVLFKSLPRLQFLIFLNNLHSTMVLFK